MADFNFVVDTNPMAQEVSRVSNHVSGTTAAVVAMQAAVVASEAHAAEQVSRKVDRGFFSLINSQISMKSAQYFSDMNAQLALLIQFSKTLGGAMNRMENDMNRLKRDYYKIFHNLDKALENRTQQLDKPTMLLAKKKNAIIAGRMVKDIAELTVQDKDIQNTSRMAVSARVKSKTGKALQSLGGKVHENREYAEQMDRLLADGEMAQAAQVSLPVVYVKSESMAAKNSEVTFLHFPQEMEDSVKNSMEMRIMSCIDQVMNVPKSVQDQQEVYQEFQKLLATSGVDERTARYVNWLYQNGGAR